MGISTVIMLTSSCVYTSFFCFNSIICSLLDMGFKPQLDRIGGCLPPNKLPAATGALHLHHGGHGHHHAAHVPVLQLNGQPILRQTLLFSATVPPGVLDVAHRFLRHGYAMVDTVGEDDHQVSTRRRMCIATDDDDVIAGDVWSVCMSSESICH